MKENFKGSMIVKAVYDAYETKSKTICYSMLAHDFTFTSPNDANPIDKQEYFIKCWPLSDDEPIFAIEKIIEEGNNVFVVYNCITKTGGHFRNAEVFIIENNLVKSIEVFFGLKQI